MNRLLRSQLRRFFSGGTFDIANVHAFLAAVDAAYTEADDHSNRLIHSIEVMSNELGRHNAELADRNARLEHLNALVVELARHGKDDPESQYQRITETCARTIGVARTSLWSVESDRLVCIDLFNVDTNTHETGLEILATQFPTYFAAIHRDRSIAAHDAKTDPRTREFYDSYLCSMGISSLLDTGALSDNELRAVLCIGHVGEPRRWSTEEIAFAGSIADLVAVVIESRRRRDTQAMLDHQRAFLRQVIDLIPSMVFAKDREGRFTLVNDAAATTYGSTVADMLGKRDEDFCAEPAQVAQFRAVDAAVLDSGREQVVDAEPLTNAAGEVRWFQTTKRPIVEPDGKANMLLGVATDITFARKAAEERLKLEASMRQMQKLESLGLLAGGIAHDLNNIMTPILMTTSLLLETSEPGSTQAEDLESILSAAESARELTSQLLAFGRKQVLSLATIDLNDAVGRAVRLIQRLIPTSIQIVTRLQSGAVIRADATQINQVIVNLVMNARDAIAGQGTITITTRTRADDRAVELIVEDTGIGMDETTLSHIFDPFFTTKELGRGTGLGLSTVHGIVDQHQGTIAVASQLGRGTRFTVTLPQRERASSNVPIQVPRSESDNTILLVEDESPIRRLVERVLVGEGYHIISAVHAEEALSLVRAHEGRINLLLTDVVLPGMSGPALYDHLKPSVDRVIFMSGHARDALKGQALPTGSSFLRKPFTARDLNSMVHSALG